MKRNSLARSSCSFRSSRSSISVGGRKRKRSERSSDQTPRRVRVLDVDGNDVTPLPLHRAEPGDVTSQPERLLLDELVIESGSDHTKSSSSLCGTSCSSFMGSSQLFNAASLTKDSDHSVPKLDTPINPPSELLRERDNVKQHVTEEMLAEGVDVCLSETDTISLLDIPSIIMSEDADDAEAVKERNITYAELCKNRLDNVKYVERPTQTFNFAPKDKQTQTDKMVVVDEGAIASVWDIYDSFCDQNDTPASAEKAVYPETTMNTSKGQEKRGQQSSNCSTFSTASTICSKLEMEKCEESFNTDYDLQLIMSLESFQYSLLVMERSIVANRFQTKLAAYSQLPILEDPDSTAKPWAEERNEDGEESSSSPTLEHVLTLSCQLTRGRNITSMAWNKKNPGILAVGYGDFESRNQKPSLICCWCLNNPTWPERVFHCHSCVISLDFSADNPSLLAVGMHDGTVAIYDVSQYNVTRIADSYDCLKKHLKPVWQVNWIKPVLSLEDREAVVSVSEDGRIARWFHCSKHFDCSDLMKLGKTYAKIKKTKQVLPLAVTSVFCVDFHPTESNIYLVGTSEGPIHKGCVSNNMNFLDTYQHVRPVNDIKWSPFSSDVFLSCSSGWIIHLWRKDIFTPLLSLTSTQMVVDSVKWSPNWSTVFAARNEDQVEIWDLNSSIMHPTIVHHAAAGVKVKSLLFTKGTDCVLLGDTDGQVTVYRIKNLRVGEDEQVDSLDDIINSAASG